jgi:hypothetical protein
LVLKDWEVQWAVLLQCFTIVCGKMLKLVNFNGGDKCYPKKFSYFLSWFLRTGKSNEQCCSNVLQLCVRPAVLRTTLFHKEWNKTCMDKCYPNWSKNHSNSSTSPSIAAHSCSFFFFQFGAARVVEIVTKMLKLVNFNGGLHFQFSC